MTVCSAVFLENIVTAHRVKNTRIMSILKFFFRRRSWELSSAETRRCVNRKSDSDVFREISLLRNVGNQALIDKAS